MSAATESDESDTMQRCASCGIAGGDDITLKKCTACHLVRYCGVKCQRDHRPKHKKACKKRAAELKDEILFKQPEGSNVGDCPICCLPMIDPQKYCLSSCCSKRVCNGCDYANKKREDNQRRGREGRHQYKCAFCRTVLPTSDEVNFKQMMRRVEANDPVALCQMAADKYNKRDYKAAFEYATRAAAMGDAEAHYQLSCLYGEGGVEKDEKKELYHLEQAAIEGHPYARNNLALWEGRNGRMDRAAKHWIIAAKLGHEKSLGGLKALYEDGDVSKDDFSAALRGYQAAIAASKSPQREEAEIYVDMLLRSNHCRWSVTGEGCMNGK